LIEISPISKVLVTNLFKLLTPLSTIRECQTKSLSLAFTEAPKNWKKFEEAYVWEIEPNFYCWDGTGVVLPDQYS